MSKQQVPSPDSVSTTSTPKRRRRKVQPVILRFCSNVEPNENHPLAEVDPQMRSSQRQAVIATILARLAEHQGDEQPQDATIEDGNATGVSCNRDTAGE